MAIFDPKNLRSALAASTKELPMSEFPMKTLVVGITAALLGMILLFGSWYTVNQTERGVVLRNGALIEISEPGLHFKMPLFDSVKYVDLQNQVSHFAKISVYSQDQQPADLVVSISWHVPASEVADMYTRYGTVQGLFERLVARQVPTQAENVFGQYNAVNAVQQRAKLVADLTQAIIEHVKGPIVIDSVQLENIDFADAYEKAISDRMNAEVAVATRNQELEKERVSAKIQVTQAQAEADSNLAKARAEAEAVRIRGEADASAIRAKAQALAQNENLVELTKAEKWDGKLPTTMLPNSAVPFLGK